MNAERTRTVVVTIGARSQALDATLPHTDTVPFFCSHAWHGMACAVLWLTTCCGSNLVPTLHAYSYIYMWRQWTGRLDQKCRTDACAGKKRKEKESSGDFFLLLGTIFFSHLASHAREMSGAGEGEHLTSSSSAPQRTWRTDPIFFCRTAELQRGKSEVTSVLGIGVVVSGTLVGNQTPVGPRLEADQRSHFSVLTTSVVIVPPSGYHTILLDRLQHSTQGYV
jgi:hypothetical protein